MQAYTGEEDRDHKGETEHFLRASELQEGDNRVVPVFFKSVNKAIGPHRHSIAYGLTFTRESTRAHTGTLPARSLSRVKARQHPERRGSPPSFSAAGPTQEQPSHLTSHRVKSIPRPHARLTVAFVPVGPARTEGPCRNTLPVNKTRK